MWKLRGCPRCSGDIFIYEDLEGTYEQCLQCSFACEFREPKEPRRAGSVEGKRKLSIPIPKLNWQPTKISGIPFTS